MQSAINEKTASLKAGMESLQRENNRLQTEPEQNKNNFTKVIIAAVIALIIGFMIAKVLPNYIPTSFILLFHF